MRSLTAIASSLTEGIKINAVHCEHREGRAIWFKRRRASAGPVIFAANGFFRLARAPVRTLPDLAMWQEWEVACYRALHGEEGFVAFAEGARSVGAEAMPGRNLTCFLDGGMLTPSLAASAARELRRAHAWWSPQFGGLWSHGDPHAGNFIYDEQGARSRLIDFEVMHDPLLSEAERHADDLLVFLQDMVGRIAPEKWLPCAEAFLTAYDRPEILELVRRKLVLPGWGFARLWWGVRTTFLSLAELRERMEALRLSPAFEGRKTALAA
jgi:hypothetical protein